MKRLKINIDLAPLVYGILLSPLAYQHGGWEGAMAMWGVVGILTHYKKLS